MNHKITHISLSALLALSLSACGGGGGGIGGGGSSDDSDTVTLDTNSALFSEVQFSGAQQYDGSIDTSNTTTAATLSVSDEVVLTAGGESSFTITPTLDDGYYVQAYLYTMSDTDSSYIIPVDAEGQSLLGETTSRIAQSDKASHLLKKINNKTLLKTTATTTQGSLTQACASQSDSFDIGDNQSGDYYDAVMEVYALIGTSPLSADSFNINTFLAALSSSELSWSEPASINLKAVSVETGTLQITLSWDNDADVDLHLIEPDGNEIYFANPDSNSGDGFLDLDDIDGYGPENIYFNDTILAGTYRIEVHHYSGSLPANYTVTFKNGSSTQSYSGTLTSYKQEDIIDTFTHSGLGTPGSDSDTDTDTDTDTDSDFDWPAGTEVASCGVVTSMTVSGTSITSSLCFENYPVAACESYTELEDEIYENLDGVENYSTTATVYNTCPSSFSSECIFDMNDYTSSGEIPDSSYENCVNYSY